MLIPPSRKIGWEEGIGVKRGDGQPLSRLNNLKQMDDKCLGSGPIKKHFFIIFKESNNSTVWLIHC